MPKSEHLCLECDNHYVIKYDKTPDDIKHCPFCGGDLEPQDANELVDDDDVCDS